MTSARTLPDLFAILYTGHLNAESTSLFLARLSQATGANEAHLLHGDANCSPRRSREDELSPELTRICIDYLRGMYKFDHTSTQSSGTDARSLNPLPASFDGQEIQLASLNNGSIGERLDAAGTEILQFLLPLLEGALSDGRELARTLSRANRAEAALDCLQAATFLLEKDGRIVYSNKAAAILLEVQDGVSLFQGRLVCEDSRCQTRFEALIASTLVPIEADESCRGGATLIARRSGKSAYQIRLVPLCSSRTGEEASGLALAFVTSTEERMRLPAAVLQGLYGLSEAESQIVNRLLAGMRLEEIAETRHVALGTVRIQMKSVFQKTGTRRQSDLLRLLLRLPSCL